uniref:thymidine phosphorylase n=1 Tax=Schlesneria paludicola TaxID=360056 RepID=A0A7C4LJA1_9PLAN
MTLPPPAQLIARKRDGYPLEEVEISAFVQGFARGEIPDYQMAALAMAIYFRGLSLTETKHLTSAMLRTGQVLHWTPGGPPKVDKHSTGGLGDKISLILAPLLACCGVQVPMISGRGLGATGGTLDKLESIPGFRTDLSVAEICEVTERIGCVITGQTDDLVPADKWLYALRDVTATVPSIPLITASILSKKLAESLDALVLDVKVGSGAFMKTEAEARALAASLVAVGREAGLRVAALLTDMHQPLGRMVGNAVEVHEALAVLRGEVPPDTDLRRLTLALGSEALLLAKAAPSSDDAARRLERALDSGEAYGKFRDMVRAQGGDLEAPRPIAPASEVVADQEGFLAAIDGEALGWAVVSLGGGRRQATDAVDHAVGLEMLARLGDRIARGQPLVRVFAPEDKAVAAREAIRAALSIAPERPPPRPLIVGRIAADPPAPESGR